MQVSHRELGNSRVGAFTVAIARLEVLSMTNTQDCVLRPKKDSRGIIPEYAIGTAQGDDYFSLKNYKLRPTVFSLLEYKHTITRKGEATSS